MRTPVLSWVNLRSARLVLALDLAGTFLYGAQGASLAIVAHFDLLGIAVVAFVSALGGGMMRDVLIGAAPPAAIRDWRYASTALVAGVLAFLAYAELPQVSPTALLVLDAGGLALFSIAGARKTLDSGLNPFAAILMAAVTASGGGVIRDVLLNQVPTVLRTDFYASAALGGGAAMILARRFRASPDMAAAIGVVTCFTLRMAGALLHWRLPSLAH